MRRNIRRKDRHRKTLLSKSISKHLISLWLLVIFCNILSQGCATPGKPDNPDNICSVFRENPDWYADAYSAYKKWGVPVHVLMAIMHKESKFAARAKPPRKKCCFIIPGPRPSSAYGYSQALDSTWEKYKRHSGNWGADRDDFADAVDFIGWYCDQSHKVCGISKWDPYGLYLAYHEGQGGYNRKTYARKASVKRYATVVKRKAEVFSAQLKKCEKGFSKPTGCCLWPF